MNKKKIAIILNIVLVIAEVIGLVSSISQEHRLMVEYYTIDSNVITFISSILFLLFYGKKEFVKDLRFISTGCLTVTMLVVIFILTPMYSFDYKLLMFTGNFFVFHTLCPMISIVSYIFFEEGTKKKNLVFYMTLLYGITLILLNVLKVVVGPYPFLMVYNQTVWMSILWCVIILGLSEAIGLGIHTLNRKRIH